MSKTERTSTGAVVLVQLMSCPPAGTPHGNFKSPPTIRFAEPTKGASWLTAMSSYM